MVAALFFAILLASPILNANAYAASGFSTLHLRQLSLHNSSLDKRQTIVCQDSGYSPCPDDIGCCPTGFACLPNRRCNVLCTTADIRCRVGCCMPTQFCGSDNLCYDSPPPPPLSPPTPVISTVYLPPPPSSSLTTVTLSPLFPTASSSSSSTTTSVLAIVQTTANSGATPPSSAASGAPIGCMRLPSLLLLAVVIAHLGLLVDYGVF